MCAASFATGYVKYDDYASKVGIMHFGSKVSHLVRQFTRFCQTNTGVGAVLCWLRIRLNWTSTACYPAHHAIAIA